MLCLGEQQRERGGGRCLGEQQRDRGGGRCLGEQQRERGGGKYCLQSELERSILSPLLHMFYKGKAQTHDG
ncbi:hypothetical protein ATANTOWER_012627 [Ataeniobius toweri]|uniref:Uncharacterized protein n=1 Tax=Ataeniobius toweri TaxID=208326 RepID=A0ABU7BGD5_9TELE|nr:hypothetical protein [Ataeniobius toweri]